MSNPIELIKKFSKHLKFSQHAKDEMLYEEFGEIYEVEIKEALTNCELLEEYSGDRLYPSYLLFGKTNNGRPLHIVCAPLIEDEKLVIITVYQPDPALWVDFRWRKS
ncbi:MAG: DUF4258 domain-containing protein [Deltaproteobacteria bacterium]|nr:DUF4258 domain-containing protein [Deltaproteobacteria bacterium]